MAAEPLLSPHAPSHVRAHLKRLNQAFGVNYAPENCYVVAIELPVSAVQCKNCTSSGSCTAGERGSNWALGPPRVYGLQ